MAYVFVDRDLISELYVAEKHTGKSITQLANEALMWHLGIGWREGKVFDSLFCQEEEPLGSTRKLARMGKLIIERDFFFRMHKIQCATGEKISDQAARAIQTHLDIIMSLKKQDAL